MIEMEFDLTKPLGNIHVLRVRQGETEFRIKVSIYNDGIEEDFSDKYLELCVIRPDRQWVSSREACVQEGNSNVFTVTFPVEALVYPGIAKVCYFAARTTSDVLVGTGECFTLDIDSSATFSADVGPYCDQVHELITALTVVQMGFEAAAGDFTERGERLLENMRSQLSDLVNNRLSYYVDNFVKQSVNRELTDMVTRTSTSVVDQRISDFKSTFTLTPDRFDGILPPEKGGTGATSRRAVKEWLGLELDTYTVTFSGENCKVDSTTPAEKTLQVTEEDTCTFTIEPDEGYYIASVKVGETELFEPYSFIPTETCEVTITANKIFKVTFTGENFSVEGQEEKTLDVRGTECGFTLTADEGFNITDVQADHGTLEGENPYTLKEIDQDVTVTVTTEASDG